ncbi:phage tail protein [Pseudomonas protegens]|uniref:phage tail protein n=1 Tax=Pseudomonas protegens TaxID=380021 RepID=UPI0039057855
MADLPESNEWTTGIYQLETSDPVLGGPEGIDNLQAKQLANRTRWLKEKTDSLGVSLAGKAGKATTLGGYGITDAFTKPEATSAIQQAIASLVASSPAALDTLKELADALGNDPNFATTMTNALAGKAGKATTLGGYGITDAFTKPETTSAIQQAIASLVASSPAALDTLKELADALGNDPNFATTMTNALAGKASKATTLAGYGITDAYAKTGTYSKAEVDELLKYATSLPVGAMVPFPKGTVPAGFLEVDGSVQSAATYPDLAAYLGTTFNKGDEGAGNFRLPESRGEFLRGWDHGRGVDAGRAVGSWQKGTMVSADTTGSADGMNVIGLGTTVATPLSDFGIDQIALSNYPPQICQIPTSGLSAVNPIVTGSTRPRNLAVMWCIKAWNAPINQGNIDVTALAQLATQATEINQGTAKVATTAHMLDSANDVVMPTPKKLRWGFSISLASNGYIAFPSWLGGLVLQWGASVGFSSTPAAVTFAMAFPTAAYAVVATNYMGATNVGATQDAVASFGLSTTGVSFKTFGGAVPNGVKYIAIGS